ncbi:MAG: hypothetical protein HY286_08145 [Planctomycetes bacterium]|nr:hypothetical protein [Planctomycetota bacterium]
MHRVQLLLEAWQYEALKSAAARSGKSVSEVVRQIVTKEVGVPSGRSRSEFDAISGIVNDAPSVARDHDKYIYVSKRRKK